MPPQEPIRTFALEVRFAFEAYLNKESASARTLMNATKLAQYFHFFANRERKIVEKDKLGKARLHSEKRQAIKEYCVNSRRQLLNVAKKKEDITKPQALLYDAFDHIKRINARVGTTVTKRPLSK